MIRKLSGEVPACKTIQAILRHANVSTTLAFYVETSAQDSIAAMAKLERALGNEWATPKRTDAPN